MEGHAGSEGVESHGGSRTAKFISMLVKPFTTFCYLLHILMLVHYLIRMLYLPHTLGMKTSGSVTGGGVQLALVTYLVLLQGATHDRDCFRNVPA